MIRLYSVCSYGFDRYHLFSSGVLRVLMTLLSLAVPEWIDELSGLIFNCESFFPVVVYRVFPTGGFHVFTTLRYVVLNNRCWKLFSIEDFKQFCNSFVSIWNSSCEDFSPTKIFPLRRFCEFQFIWV